MRKASDMNGDIHIVSTWLAENEMTLGLLNNDGIDYGKKRVSLKQRMLCAIYDQKYLESLLEQMWRQSRTEPCCPSSIPHSSFLIPHSTIVTSAQTLCAGRKEFYVLATPLTFINIFILLIISIITILIKQKRRT